MKSGRLRGDGCRQRTGRPAVVRREALTTLGFPGDSRRLRAIGPHSRTSSKTPASDEAQDRSPRLLLLNEASSGPGGHTRPGPWLSVKPVFRLVGRATGLLLGGSSGGVGASLVLHPLVRGEAAPSLLQATLRPVGPRTHQTSFPGLWSRYPCRHWKHDGGGCRRLGRGTTVGGGYHSTNAEAALTGGNRAPASIGEVGAPCAPHVSAG
jgi:hypothetical protein